MGRSFGKAVSWSVILGIAQTQLSVVYGRRCENNVFVGLTSRIPRFDPVLAHLGCIVGGIPGLL